MSHQHTDDILTTSGMLSDPALIRAQQRENRRYRESLDNAALASMPMLTIGGPPTYEIRSGFDGLVPLRTGGIVPRITNSQEDTMAKRKTKTKKARRSSRPAEHVAIDNETARIRKAEADRIEYENRKQGVYDNANTSTAAERLAPEEAAPRNAEAVQIAYFIAAYFLECMGFGLNEIGELMECSTNNAYDRVNSGRSFALRLGVNAGHLTDRNRAMRENAWADGARKAAKAMQERIVDAIPAFIRLAESGKIGDAHGIAAVVKMVQAFSPDDVVQVSKAAKDLAGEPRNATGAVTGRLRGEMGANEPSSRQGPIQTAAQEAEERKLADYWAKLARDRAQAQARPHGAVSSLHDHER